MASLISVLPLLLSTAVAPIAVEDLQVNVRGDVVTEIVLRLGAPPTFTTSSDPERFVVDLLEVQGEEGRLSPDAPGVRGVVVSPSNKGMRLVVELEPGAQPTVDVDGQVVSIRVERARRTKAAAAADDMDAALEGLAAQVARIGGGMARLRDPAPGDAAEVVDASAESSAGVSAAVADASAESSADVSAAVAGASAESVAEAKAEAAKASASAESESESVAEPSPAVADASAESSSESASESLAEGSGAAADATAAMVGLGFRPTHDGAELVIRTDGRVSPRLEEGVGEMVLVLPHTTIRRPNDKRPFDATYFNTPVGLVRPSVSRQGVRITIQLRQEAVAKVAQKTGEIVVELLSR